MTAKTSYEALTKNDRWYIVINQNDDILETCKTKDEALDCIEELSPQAVGYRYVDALGKEVPENA